MLIILIFIKCMLTICTYFIMSERYPVGYTVTSNHQEKMLGGHLSWVVGLTPLFLILFIIYSKIIDQEHSYNTT